MTRVGCSHAFLPSYMMLLHVWPFVSCKLQLALVFVWCTEMQQSVPHMPLLPPRRLLCWWVLVLLLPARLCCLLGFSCLQDWLTGGNSCAVVYRNAPYIAFCLRELRLLLRWQVSRICCPHPAHIVWILRGIQLPSTAFERPCRAAIPSLLHGLVASGQHCGQPARAHGFVTWCLAAEV